MAKFKKHTPKKPKKEYNPSRKKQRGKKKIINNINQSTNISNFINQLNTPKPQTQAQKLNSALKYASDKFGNRNDYSKYLTPILGEMMGDNFMMQLVTNPKSTIGDYKDFTISPNFDGNLNNLFKYITFKNIPPQVSDSFIENILDLEWSTPEKYNKHIQEINSKIYASNLQGQGLDNTIYYVMLSDVLQSSAAWNIAKRSAYDSDQVQENWYTLYTAGMEAHDHINSAPDIWDKFVQMVENEEDLDTIIDTVDELITKAMKG